MRTIHLLLLLFICHSSFSQQSILKLDNISSSNENYQDLLPLKKTIGNAKVVFLGEPSHGEGDVFEAKARLVKFLHQEMGFSTIAFESCFYDFQKIEQSVAKGESYLEGLKRSILPIWANSQEFQPMLKYLYEKKENLNVIGFDSQFIGEYSIELLFSDLFQLDKELKLNLNELELAFLNQSTLDLTETLDFEDDFKIKKLLSILKRYEKKLNHLQEDTIVLHQPVHFWKQVFHNIKEMSKDYYYNHPARKKEQEFKAKDSNIRDHLMAQNLLYYIQNHPNEKIICWLANGHFANQFKGFQNNELDEFHSMGSHIKNSLGNENVFSLASVCARGQHALHYDKQAKKIPIPSPGSLEDRLLKDSIKYAIVPLKDGLQTISFGIDYSTPFTGEWSSTYDAILFLHHTDRSHFCTKPFEAETESIKQDFSIKEKPSTLPIDTLPVSKKFTYQSLTKKHTDFRISSTIVDHNKKAIPYVNIGLVSSSLGTISDFDGNFSLAIAKKNIKDTLSFSCIGYQNIKIPVQKLLKNNKKQIVLSKRNYELNQVMIRQERITAKKVLKRAIKAIKTNYTQKPYKQEYLSRNTALLIKKPVIYESIQTYYDIDGFSSHALYMSGVKEFAITQDRQVARIDSNRNQLSEFKRTPKHVPFSFSGYSLLDYVNFRKNTFLNKLKWFRYDFQLEDTLQYQNQTVFKINFNCKYPSHRSTIAIIPITFYGYIYINLKDYAIVKVETNSVVKDLYAKKGEQKKFCFEQKVACYSKQGNFYYPHYLATANNYEKHSIHNEQFAGKAVTYSKKEINDLFKKPTTQQVISDEHWQKLRQHEKYIHRFEFVDLEPFVKK
jgi:erythromycin esterase-like protein